MRTAQLLTRQDFFSRWSQSGMSQMTGASLIVVKLKDFLPLQKNEGKALTQHLQVRTERFIQKIAKRSTMVGTLCNGVFLVAYPQPLPQAQEFAVALSKQIFRELCVSVSVGAGRTLAQAQIAIQ
jgi:hypothetical protein